ncbi:hypothetical protein [Flagellimonas nanhaiensis]|uniref:GLPGLI family protein n=1 Tax=Flagellimonas nanhaiensis TaxID=2292706 RepID=A0A371JPA7_9FLAO|nr:hypothetical protein [Allomuricauda nanhaiensis]RDY59273.1 hypothetical protein DX873_07700 [Allomuricauda nanhaiensis]
MKLSKPVISFVLYILALFAFTRVANAQELFVDKKKHLKNLQEVKLANFTVSFTTSEGKSASTISRNNFMGAKSALRVITSGLTNELMQRITDEAYADFVEKLEAHGFTITEYRPEEKLIKSMAPYFKRTENYAEDVDYYQPFSHISTITVSAGNKPFVKYGNQYMVGHAAKQNKENPITVNYLINSGYLQANAKKREDKFFGKIYNKTKVAFLPGVQVFWRSGINVWSTKSAFGEIKINTNVYREGPAGELVTKDQSNLIRRSNATLELIIDPDKYYNDAMSVLKEVNTKLINEMAKYK